MFKYILFAGLMGIVIGASPEKVKRLDRICGYNMKANENKKRLRESYNSASFGEFPWTVIVFNKNKNNKFYYECDGSLIHPQIVLTIADCAKKLTTENSFIRAGEKDSLSKKLNNPQNRFVREIIIHKEFNDTTLDNNFALIVLDEPFDTDAENVDILCLPKSLKEIYVGKKCKVSIIDKNINDNKEDNSRESEESNNSDDLSKVNNLNELNDSKESDIPDYLDDLIEFYEPEESDELDDSNNFQVISTKTKQYDIDIVKFDLVMKTAELEIVDNDKCMKNNNKLTNSFICGKSKARSHLCEANRGSPIVCPHPNDPTRWVHVGSFAVKCDDPFDKKKDIYINIAKAREWIIQTLNDLRTKLNDFID